MHLRGLILKDAESALNTAPSMCKVRSRLCLSVFVHNVHGNLCSNDKFVSTLHVNRIGHWVTLEASLLFSMGTPPLPNIASIRKSCWHLEALVSEYDTNKKLF